MRVVPVLVLVLAGLIPAQNRKPPDLCALVKGLASDDTQTWQIARYKLVQVGSDAVPLLIPHLRDEHAELRFLRVRVVNVLGRVGAGAALAMPQLEKLMRGADKHLGNLAARSIVQIDPEHPAAIARLLQCGDPVSMMVVCRALGRGGVSAVPRLQEMVRGRHKGVRTFAGQALARLVSNPDVEIGGSVLLSMLDIDSHVVRRAVLARLGDMSNPPKSTADKVRLLLASRSARERIAAIECLCAIEPQPTWLLTALIARAQDRNRSVQRAARESLLLHRPEVVKGLAIAEDWRQRRTAAETLRLMEVEDEASPAIPLLVRLLQDPKAEVRRAAADSLGNLAPHSRLAMTELKLALKDRDAGVRMAAVKALATFRGTGVEVPEAEMAGLLDDANASVRVAALEALPTEALPTLALDTAMLERLVDLLADEDVRIRRVAFCKLRARVRSRRVPFDETLRKRAFAAALAVPDSALRKQARAALRLQSYEPKGGELLSEFLDHEDPMVRAEAAVAFGEMGKTAQKYLPRLRKRLEDPEPRVRQAAKQAVARIEEVSKKNG